MKDYYFMRKPGVVDASEYEQNGGYVRYYSKKGEWQKKAFNKQRYVLSSSLKKQRRMLYLFSILFIIAIFIIWKGQDATNKDLSSYYNADEGLLYFIKLSDDNKKLTAYTRNMQNKAHTLNKQFTISCFYRRNKKNILIQELSANIRSLKVKENALLGECILDAKVPKGRVGAIINKHIVLSLVLGS